MLDYKEPEEHKIPYDSDAFYKVIVETTTDAITIHDKGEILFANKAFACLVGFNDASDVIGKYYFDFGPPDAISNEKMHKHKINVKNNYSEPISEMPIFRPDKALLYVEVSSAPIIYKGRKAVLNIHRDITEQKAAEKWVKEANLELIKINSDLNDEILKHKETEKALGESEKRFRILFEQAADAIVLTDIETKRFVDFNHVAHETLGYTREEFKELRVHDIEVQKLEHDRQKHFENIMKLGEDTFETKAVAKNGEIYDFLKKVRSVSLGGKEYFLGVWHDITNRKKLEDQFRRSQKMEAIGTLAGGIAHDFNNILGIIVGNAELAMDDVPEDNPARENLNEIRTASLRARDVVKQILDYSLQSRQEMKPHQLGIEVKGVLKLIRSLIPATVEIKLNISTDSDAIMADVAGIKQILLNLCTNAAQSLKENVGVLTIGLENVEYMNGAGEQIQDLKSGRYVKLSVSDSGPGFDESIKERIFDPYFTTKEVGSGSGMGLSVVAGIVKRHGGAINVISKVGKGTTFELFFPHKEKDAILEEESPAIPPGGNESILFVDDEPAMINSVTIILKRLGYKVASEISSENALRIFQENPDKFDLIITDMTMPKMTGFDLAQEIKAIRSDIPIILCTGYNENINEEKIEENGIDLLLMKPMVISEIAQAIHNVMQARREE